MFHRTALFSKLQLLLLSVASSVLFLGNEVASEYTFALVAKQRNNPFFDAANEGCTATAKSMGNIQCLYIEPDTANATLQAELIRDLIGGEKYGKIDGIAMSVIEEEIATEVIEESMNAGIPIITYDSDATNSQRLAYIGTNNTAFGQELGKLLLQLVPEGGKYGIITSSEPNVMQRLYGVRDRLKDTKWEEVGHSPLYCKDSIDIALENMYEFANNETSSVHAIIPVGGWPMFDSTGWESFVDKFANITTVVGDTLDVQLQLMNRKRVNGLVGQLPYEMGSLCVETLFKIINGDTIKSEILGTELLEVLRFPLNLKPVTVDENYIGNLAILGYVLFSIIAISSLLCLGWTYYYRKIRVVRASQPEFLGMICIGVLIMSIAIVSMTIDDEKYDQAATDAACMSNPWLLSFGFTTVFSALFSKTWRVNKIFHSAKRFTRVTVKMRDVILPYVGLMTLNAIALTCWTIIDPWTFERLDKPGTDDWNRVIERYGKCTSDNYLPYFIVILTANVGLLVLANFQSYQARSIQTEYSESKYISFIMASLLQAFLMGTPILLLTYDDPRIYFEILVTLIFVICMSVLSLIFVPKFLYLREWQIEEAQKSLNGANGGNAHIFQHSSNTDDEDNGLKMQVLKLSRPSDPDVTNRTSGSNRADFNGFMVGHDGQVTPVEDPEVIIESHK